MRLSIRRRNLRVDHASNPVTPELPDARQLLFRCTLNSQHWRSRSILAEMTIKSRIERPTQLFWFMTGLLNHPLRVTCLKCRRHVTQASSLLRSCSSNTLSRKKRDSLIVISAGDSTPRPENLSVIPTCPVTPRQEKPAHNRAVCVCLSLRPYLDPQAVASWRWKRNNHVTVHVDIPLSCRFVQLQRWSFLANIEVILADDRCENNKHLLTGKIHPKESISSTSFFRVNRQDTV